MGLLASISCRALVLGLASVLGCTNEYASVDLGGGVSSASGSAAEGGAGTGGVGAEGGAGSTSMTSSAGGNPSATASSSTTGSGPGGAGGMPCVACEIPVGLSKWVGTYLCAQGITSVDLDITREPVTDHLAAFFSWYAHPSNPGVPSGSFTMDGTYDPNAHDVVLDAVQWVDHPPGYGMVDLVGAFEPPSQRIAGDVIFSGCSTFEVFKQ